MPTSPTDWLNTLANTAENVAIDSNAASITAFNPDAGKRFLIYDLYIQVEAATELTFKSGSTALSGPINFTYANQDKGWGGTGAVLFRGDAIDDNFVIDNSGSAQCNGWMLVGESSA